VFERKRRKSKEARAKGKGVAPAAEARDAAASTGPASDAAPASDRPGPDGPGPGGSGAGQIGRYRILEPLGQGGMGRVFLAHDPVIDRDVAIKLITLRPDMPEQDVRQYHERFLREAQAAGALIHPHIVAVHDIGRDPHSDRPFIVMEHVAGRDLKKVIRERAPVGPHEAVRIAAQIASALDFAHRRGIVHRDIKPANVLLGDGGQVKITDFGVARLPDSDLTQSDQFVGSPGFMSPEQLKGGTADGRSDLFALGVILYQLLTGRSPFEGESVSEVLYKISTQPPDPPSEAHADVSADFDPILERALAKDPDDRYQTGQEMLAALMEAAERLPDTVSAVGAAAMQPGPAALKSEPAATMPAGTGLPVSVAGDPASETADPGGLDDRRAITTGSGPLPLLRQSGWWNLESQWRLGALMTLLLATLIGMNWGILALFRGPFARLAADSAGTSPGLPKDSGPLALVGAAIGGPPPPAVAPQAGATSPSSATAGQASSSGIAGPSICAMTYAEPAQIARVLEARTSLKQDDGRAGTTPTARLRVELKHRLSSGRIVVLLDGRTILSKPFGAGGHRSGALSHLLTVPAGRHGVEVRLTSAKGAVEGRAKISGTLDENTLTVLKGELPKGKGGKLTLAWAAPKDQAAVRSEQ
jgi:serine/threonine-protein kinase